MGAESFIVEGTIRDNLLYGLEHSPTSQEINSAIELAECSFIHELPKKLDHPLTENGQGLSAGQKQRIALARALLRRPKALILDEATANLDSETEARLIQTLQRLKKNHTILAVTHRPALVEVADRTLELGATRHTSLK